MLTISKKEIIMFTAGVVGSITVIVTYVMKKKVEKTTYKVESIEQIPSRKMGFYEKYLKRYFDIICAIGAIVCFSPIVTVWA